MAVRIVFRDPARSDKVYSSANKWELTDHVDVIIKAAGNVIAQFALADVFSLEIE